MEISHIPLNFHVFLICQSLVLAQISDLECHRAPDIVHFHVKRHMMWCCPPGNYHLVREMGYVSEERHVDDMGVFTL